MSEIKLKKYSVKNYKGVDFICVEPDSDSVFITVEGQNESGKTSFLDAMFLVLCGGELPVDPIRKGEDKAEIFVDLGTYTVQRVLKRDTKQQPGIELKKKDGDVTYKIEKPREILKNMINKFTLDPVEISEMNNEELAEVLKKASGLNFEEEEATYYAEFEKRKDFKKDLASKTAQLTPFLNMPKVEKGRTEEVIQIDIDGAEARNKSLEAEEKYLADKKVSLGKCPEEIQKILDASSPIMAEYELQIKKEEEVIEACKKQIETLKIKITNKGQETNFKVDQINNYKKELTATIKETTENIALNSGVDITPFKEEIKKAREYEAVKFKFEAKTKLKEEVKKCENDITNCNEAMEKAKKVKAEKIKNAKLPEGITLEGKIVSYNGTPFTQESQARRIRIAVEIISLMNPTIKLMRIANGNSILPPMWEEIEKIVKEFKFQILVEKCVMNPTGDKNSYFIEDGKLKTEGGDK